MSTILGREPIVILTVVGNLIALAVAYGIDIDTSQKAAIMAAISAVLAFIGRSQVTPVTDSGPE